MLAAKDDEIGRLRSERSGREIRRDIAEPPQTADAAVGPDESMNSPRNSPINSPGAASGAGPASAADTAALLAAAGGEEGGYGALASRFARRVSELESQVAAARAQCSAAREESTETARQERALRGRVAHLTRALERSRGGGEYDAEYVHNVMLNWLLLSDEERTPLLPVRLRDSHREDFPRDSTPRPGEYRAGAHLFVLVIRCSAPSSRFRRERWAR